MIAQHTDRSSEGGCYWCDGETPCIAPTPDPASPCGYEGCSGGMVHGYDETCLHDLRTTCHPHVPTLCTCGHPITRSGK